MIRFFVCFCKPDFESNFLRNHSKQRFPELQVQFSYELLKNWLRFTAVRKQRCVLKPPKVSIVCWRTVQHFLKIVLVVLILTIHFLKMHKICNMILIYDLSVNTYSISFISKSFLFLFSKLHSIFAFFCQNWWIRFLQEKAGIVKDYFFQNF